MKTRHASHASLSGTLKDEFKPKPEFFADIFAKTPIATVAFFACSGGMSITICASLILKFEGVKNTLEFP